MNIYWTEVAVRSLLSQSLCHSQWESTGTIKYTVINLTNDVSTNQRWYEVQCSAYSICVDECEVERYSTKIDFENITFTEKNSWTKNRIEGFACVLLYKSTIIIYTMRQTDILQIWYHRITTFIKFQNIELSSSTH